LREKIVAEVNMGYSKLSEAIIDYAIESLSAQYPSLIKDFLGSRSMLKLAGYLYGRGVEA
jgi:hypothetical protein